MTLVVVLTVAEYLVKVCYSPAAFTYADELMHWRTATDIAATGKLFTANNLLPISPYYPGLEEVTSALASVTGLSIFISGLIVAGVAHLLFVCVLFVLFRYVSGSHRVAGVALLLYSSESLFQSFDSMFVYQTLALPFLGLTVLATYRLAAPQAAGHRAGWFTLAVLSASATVVTHHVTSYLLVATLEVITLGALLARDRRLVAGPPSWLWYRRWRSPPGSCSSPLRPWATCSPWPKGRGRASGHFCRAGSPVHRLRPRPRTGRWRTRRCPRRPS